MLPFRKILFPVDYSDPCKALAPYVGDMACHFSAGLTLVHAYNLGSFATSEINLVEPGLIEECVAIERPFVALFRSAISDNAPAVRIDDADDDADALLLDVDPLGENAPDFGVRGCDVRGRRRRLRRRLPHMK